MGTSSFNVDTDLHDNARLHNILTNRLVRQNAPAIDKDFILDMHVFSKDRDIVNSSPPANRRVPSDNRLVNPGVLFSVLG